MYALGYLLGWLFVLTALGATVASVLVAWRFVPRPAPQDLELTTLLIRWDDKRGEFV